MAISLGKYGLLAQLADTEDESLQGGIRSQETDLTALLDAYEHARNRIFSDRGLNAGGQRGRLMKLQQETISALDTFRANHARSLASIEAERALVAHRLEARLDYAPVSGGGGLIPLVKPAEAERAELRERECRDRLLTLDPLVRFSTVMTAAEKNDVELLRAVAHAPLAFPLLPAEHLADVHARHIARHYPQEARRLRELEAYKDTWHFNVNTARAHVTRGGQAASEVLPDAAA